MEICLDGNYAKLTILNNFLTFLTTAWRSEFARVDIWVSIQILQLTIVLQLLSFSLFLISLFLQFLIVSEKNLFQKQVFLKLFSRWRTDKKSLMLVMQAGGKIFRWLQCFDRQIMILTDFTSLTQITRSLEGIKVDGAHKVYHVFCVPLKEGGWPRGVMVKANTFRANTLGKGMNPLILPAVNCFILAAFI